MPQVQIWEVWLSPKKTSESQTISKIGIVTLGWNAVSKVNISEQEPPTTAEPPDQSLLQVRECLEKVKSCIEKHKNAAQTAKKNIVTWSDYMMFWGMLYASEKLQNLYMNRFINSQSFENPWPASELKPKNEKWSAWAILSGHSERGCGCCMKQLWHRWHIRGFWEIWACCQDLYIFFSTSRWKGLLHNMADIYDVKTPTFLKQSLHRKRFQTICDLELVVSACSVCRCALGFSKSVHVFWQKNMCIHGCMLQTPYMLHVCISSEKQYIYIYSDGLQPECWLGEASIQYDLRGG